MQPSTRRLGVLFPPGNVAMERELPRLLPDGVAMHCNRLSRPDSVLSSESLLAMVESVPRAAMDLAQTYPEVIIYGCTSGSFLGPRGDDEKIAGDIETLTGIPAVTTSRAVQLALKEVGIRRAYMVTPYPDALNTREAEFLGGHGITVTGWDNFPCTNSEEIRAISSEEVAELVLRHRAEIAQCDGVFISCTQLLTVDRLDDLERELGKPVVSSNQASLWAALRHMKVDMGGKGAGRLLRELASDSR